MSHYVVHVLVPEGEEITEDGGYLERVLEPFDETKEVEEYLDEVLTDEKIEEACNSEYLSFGIDRSDTRGVLEDYYGGGIKYNEGESRWERWTTYNPLSKFDWWTIGGRWSEFFPNGEDIIAVEDLDWTDARDKAEREANEEYDQMEEATKGLPEPMAWEQVREKFPNDIDLAQSTYHEQEWVRAAKRFCGWTFLTSPDEYFFVGKGGRKAFVEDAVEGVGVPYALIDLDGNWLSRGEMGWFGISDDALSKDEWAKKYNSTIEQVKKTSPKTRLVSLDFHI